MKGEINPVVGGIIIAVVVLVIGILGFKWMHAPKYQMSPGGGPRTLTPGAAASPMSSGGAFKPSGNRGTQGTHSQNGGVNNSGMNNGGQ